MANHWS